MANIREIALGLTTVLQMTTEPEPLGVDLWGQSADEGTLLVKTIIDEATDAGRALTTIRMDADYLTIRGRSELGTLYRSVRVETTDQLRHRIELHRYP